MSLMRPTFPPRALSTGVLWLAAGLLSLVAPAGATAATAMIRVDEFDEFEDTVVFPADGGERDRVGVIRV